MQGGSESYLLTHWRSRTKCSCGSSAYWGTYCAENAMVHESGACEEEEYTLPSLSDRRLQQPKTLRSSSRIRFLIRLA